MINEIIGLTPVIIYVLLLAVIGWVAYKLTNWIMNFSLRFDDDDINDIGQYRYETEKNIKNRLNTTTIVCNADVWDEYADSNDRMVGYYVDLYVVSFFGDDC